MNLTVIIKLILRKFKIIPSFCKICGRDVNDFIAPDDLWDEIKDDIRYGNVLCYDCFCELVKSKGCLGVFKLEGIE